jgi:hypothetical protein
VPAIAYPIAAHAVDVLKGFATLKTAERLREAQGLAEVRVGFVTETLEAGFPTREAAETYYTQACPGLLDQPFAQLQCRLKTVSKTKSERMTPDYEPGKRWPKPAKSSQSQWQVSVSYWKTLGGAIESPPPLDVNPKVQARAMRKRSLGQDLTPAEIKALAYTPLSPYLPQKTLDIGLFEVHLPENPNIIIADE